jgi:hypothetical protein
MVTKPTTGILYLLMPLAIAPVLLNRRFVGVLACAAVSVAAGVAWTSYADAVKASSPFTSTLTSAAVAQQYQLFSFNLSPNVLGEVVRRVHLYMAGSALEIWVPLAAWASVTRRGARPLVLLIVAAGGFLLALYGYLLVNEYALVAISPIVAAVIGLSIDWMWTRRHRLPVRGLAATLALTWCVSLVVTLDYWGRAYASPTPDPEQVLPVAHEIREEVSPSQRVAIEGREWSPAVLYYAHRDGFMITADHLTQALVSDLRTLGYARIFRCPIGEPRCESVAPAASDRGNVSSNHRSASSNE